MFGNNSNNDRNGVSVNTRFYTSFGDLAALTVTGWNQQISIKIAPQKGVDGNGVRQYDNDHVGLTSITLDNAAALYSGIEKEIMPAYKRYMETGENPGTIGIAVNMGQDKKNMLSVDFELDENGKPAFYLSFYQYITQTGAADPNYTYRHKFNVKEYYKNYDPMSGKSEVEYSQADFLNFVEVLKNRSALMMMNAHSVKYENTMREAWAARRNSSYQNNYNNNYGYRQAPVQNGRMGDLDSLIPDDDLPFH